MCESATESWVTFKVALEDCYCGKINMSGSSSLSGLETSSIQESVISRASGDTSGVSTPSGLTRPSSASSAPGSAKGSGIPRPSSEKKGKAPKTFPEKGKEPKTPQGGKSYSKPSTPSIPETTQTTPRSKPFVQTPRSTPSSAPRSRVTTPRAGPSSSDGSGRKPTPQRRFQNPKKEFFEPYFSIADLQEGLKRGELIEGVLRINPKSYADAYISAPTGGLDLFVGGVRDRNRALHGDIVVVKLKPQTEWKVLEENVYSHIAAHPEERSFFGISTVPEAPHVEPLSITPKEATVLLGALVDELGPGDSVVLPVKEVGATVEDVEETVTETKKKIRRGTRAGKARKKKTEEGSDIEIEIEGDKASAEFTAAVVPPDQLSGDEWSDESGESEVVDIEEELELRENFEVLKLVDEAVKKNVDEEKGTPQTKKGEKENARVRRRERRESDPKVVGRKSMQPRKQQKALPFTYSKREIEKIDLNIDLILKHPESQRFLQKTAEVVFLKEYKHSRCAVGHIRPCESAEDAKKYAYFSPTDSRVPRMLIPLEQCPADFKTRSEDYVKVLFVAKVDQWDIVRVALGSMVRILGSEGDIEAETEGMLIENAIDYAEFDEEVINCLPQTPWSIPQEEFEYRKDFRKQCVFTIDPSTARDLDDAVSCLPLGDGRFRVGVHIADVSYFLRENTKLDEVAGERATSVYLVQKVVPMLPRLLCEQLCSLNPGQDRLSFSVEWVIGENGDIEEEWFGRSVIRSCVKLAYEHAQSVIDNPGKYDWNEGEIPKIEPPFTIHEVCDAITNLQKIATSLRHRRQAYGALRLDLPKMFWALDKQSGMPTGFKIYELRESNRLIEELMLLANMAVARRIYTHYPRVALLRCHPPPQELMMKEVAECLASIGIHLDITTSATLQSSLLRYYGSLSALPRPEGRDYNYYQEDWTSVGRAIVMTNLIARPMVCAKYISSGTKDDPSSFRHYALAVPLYTHFTSPIRRYPDVIVHRLLAASLNYCDPPHYDCHELHRVAERCNDRKTTAKRVGDMSSEMFLGVFIKTVGPMQSRGVVLSVLDRSVDVVLLNSGLIKRVYMDKLPLASLAHESNAGIGTLTLVWEQQTDCPGGLVQVLSVFTMVDVKLEPGDNPVKFNAVLVRPGSFD